MLEYSFITPSSFEAAIKFLQLKFSDNPLNQALRYQVPGDPCPVLDDMFLEALEDGMSFMVTDKTTGKIVGVALSQDYSHSTSHDKDGGAWGNVDEIDDPKMKIFINLLNDANSELDLFDKYKVDRIFKCTVICIDPTYRNHGIGNELFARREALAREKGYKVIKCDAINFYVQRIAERRGYVVENAIKFEDYVDAQGQRIENVPLPHKEYQVLSKLLD